MSISDTQVFIALVVALIPGILAYPPINGTVQVAIRDWLY
jgi:photosystem I reaction center subunit XII